MAAENEAIRIRRGLDRATEHQRQFETWPLPRHPDDSAPVPTVELFDLAIAVRARSQSDRPVGMEVIDVIEWQERMQRRINRRGDAVIAKSTERVIPDHLVLVGLATIAVNELFELIQIEHREPRRTHRPKISTTALDDEHARRLSRHGIYKVELRTGIAAAEIRDPQIRSQQIGAVPKQFQWVSVERRRVLLLPKIL